VALLHTQVQSSIGAGDHGPYAPSDLTYLAHAGYDYWALGHVHVRQELSDDPPIWYSGSLQGKTHTDRDDRGALLVDLSDRAAPRISFRPVAPIRWDTVVVDRLDNVTSLDELERTVLVAWRALREREPGGHGTEWMVRVALEGPCPLWTELRSEENRSLLGRELGEMLGALDVSVLADRVHPVFPIEEHRSRTDVLGEALRMVEEIRRGDRALSNVDAGELAGAPADDPHALSTYVRSLLTDADGEVAARLLEDPSR